MTNLPPVAMPMEGTVKVTVVITTLPWTTLEGVITAVPCPLPPAVAWAEPNPTSNPAIPSAMKDALVRITKSHQVRLGVVVVLVQSVVGVIRIVPAKIGVRD